LPTATLFVKLVGTPESEALGAKYVVPSGGGVRIRYARLANGMQMVRASAALPRKVAVDEVVATMTGIEILQMTMKMPAHGLIVAAEDDRDSWTAIKREGFASILRGAAH
jgi:hypothetical protein